MSDFRIAVFDCFYRQPDAARDVVYDGLGEANANVYMYTDSLGEAALALNRMHLDDMQPRPDLLILGGRLGDEYTYVHNPHTSVSRENIEKRGFLGGKKIVERAVTTVLLPMMDAENQVTLPTLHGSSGAKRLLEYGDWLSRQYMSRGSTAFVLSHLTRLLLPETDIKIIGISSYNDMRDLPIDAYVERHSKDDVRVLREAVESFRQ
jgi:hypothetical protein